MSVVRPIAHGDPALVSALCAFAAVVGGALVAVCVAGGFPLIICDEYCHIVTTVLS